MDLDLLLTEILNAQEDWHVTATDTAFIIEPALADIDSDREE
ncbi:hypothetical protein [Paenibacillus aestuarii]|uniref:Uncharacterized protein n=1 Tax=Paenibacillus aestuarii TaxID=516965 RepID=A0ABW0K4I5_9BACL|nr:hypothetical protein [Paenibacillus aestuarii]